ncbi:bifunctional protein FolD 1, mitochondrial-like isoform X10 [Solanum pennellii]|uniref:methenyltetrahydrofolate cyclohydrolase n=1 Tax=Solanum pennellii TaxID=28526 RepID=A0ABM1HHC1_SOLPN|nr:bifunctional protein FolD 1, mitochondrial-like isoform X10 [Solanum pennellii]
MIPVRMMRKMVWERSMNKLSRGLSSSQIRKPRSPSLVSLDLIDEWSSTFTRSHSHPIQKSTANNDTARIIDGRSAAEEIKSSIAIEVSRMKESIGKVPGLAVILVGQRRDSLAYVRNKIMACHEVGFRFSIAELPESCTEDAVCDALSNYNKDASIHGILVQLPLPQGREPLFIPCTAKGCIELLLSSDVEIVGKRAVVIGRSNIVGLPTFLLLQCGQCLQRHHATVSIVHAYSENPEIITREADILVAAAGVPNLVRGSWLKPGAVVLDVGINPIEDPESEHGYRLIGDVCFEEAVRIASAVTPVPGGVGPMTVAMLLLNTLEAAKRALCFT